MRLRDLISQFDGFVIDQYGVLHDGVRPYPGAIAALEAIGAAGKRAVLMTNSGKSAAANEERLRGSASAANSTPRSSRQGRPRVLALRTARSDPPSPPGGKVHIVGRTGDDYGLERFPLVAVDLAAADALLISAATRRASRSTNTPSA